MGLGFYNPNAGGLYDFFSKPWSTRRYCIQKQLGYCDLYDRMAWAMGCFIHCAKSEFEYRGRWWRVELWMGRYGVSVGGEIGFYNRKTPYKPLFYNCANEGFIMNFTLKECINNKSRKLFSIATDSKYRNLGHWWLTGFRYNTNLKSQPPYSRNLQMEASILFKDNLMARKFFLNLRPCGWTNTTISIVDPGSNGRRVKIIWSSRNATLNSHFKK